MLVHYLLEPATLIAVVVPALISIWALLSSPLSPSQWKAWGISTVLALLTARWDLQEDVQQLFIIPVILLWIAAAAYNGVLWSGRQAFAACFTSLWLVDMVQAARLHAVGGMSASHFYTGVGGAGIRDGLILFPTLALLLSYYIRWRAGPRAAPVTPRSSETASTPTHGGA